MTPAWAQRQEELLSDCIVSPDVFNHMVDRLCDFVVPYQHALETEVSKRNVPLYLAGLLSHLDRKHAEQIAALVDVERLGGCPRINAHGPWRLDEAGRSCSKGPCTSSREHTQLPIPRSDVLPRAISIS